MSSPPSLQSMDTAFFGHPRGLATLFFTEMWERFSYYGMRAILVLYMVAPVATGGLGFDTVTAATIYGLYTGSVYAMSLPGGWLADRFLGSRNAIVLGAFAIAAGNGLVALGTIPLFYSGLGLIVVGTGLLKPNVSVMVGGLYSEHDTRRDSGFSIFYMGINLGAILSPLLCGYLAQRVNWHLGFACASAVMILGIIQFLAFRSTLGDIGARPPRKTALEASQPVAKLSPDAWKRLGAIAILFVFSTVFWMSFEQAGSSLNLFADQLTRDTIAGFAYPSSWFQSVEPIFVVALAPLFSLMWLRMANRQPSSPAKFAYGLVAAAVAFFAIAYASTLTGGGKVSPLWLVFVYLFQAIGELLISPVGLSTTTKLAPAGMGGLMMGVWFLSISAGNYFAGMVARLYTPGGNALVIMFAAVALLSVICAAALAGLTPSIRRLMGTVR